MKRDSDQIGYGAGLNEISGLNAIVLKYRDTVSRLKPQCNQAVGEPHAAIPCIIEGQLPVAMDHCDPLAVAADSLRHQRPDIH